MQIKIKECKFCKIKAVRTIDWYVQDVYDTCACFTSMKLLNVGQIRDYESAVLQPSLKKKKFLPN